MSPSLASRLVAVHTGEASNPGQKLVTAPGWSHSEPGPSENEEVVMTRFRWRIASVVSLLALIVGILGLTVMAKAVTVGSGTVGSFENDGNMTVDNAAGTIDWASVASSATKVVDVNADSGFQGSPKEEDPAT